MLAQIVLNLCFVCVRRGSAVGVDDLLHDVPFLPVSASLLRWMNCTSKKISCSINFSIDDAGSIAFAYLSRARARVCM